MNKTQSVFAVKTKNVTEEPGFNTRYDLGDLRPIIADMKTRGFNPAFPLIVRENSNKPGTYLLGAQGHRRLASANEAEISEVYVILEDDGLSDADRNLDIVRGNEGEPLPMLAVARVVVRALANEGTTNAEIAKAIGKSAQYVGECVMLSKTTKQTQKWIEQDKISAYNVVEIIREVEAKDEEGFKKVEEKIEKLIAKAGDKKVTKKNKAQAEEEEKETAAERKEREAKEKAEAEAAEAAKAQAKINKAILGRVEKYSENIMELVAKINEATAEDKPTTFQQAIMDYQVSLASYLTGKPVGTDRMFADSGDADKLSDVGTACRNLDKVHKETVKDIEKEAKETEKAAKKEAAEKVKAVKEAVKTATA